MQAWLVAVLGVLAVVLGGVAAGAWMVLKRPLAVWYWVSRRALRKAGLAPVPVPSPAGPQNVFVGGSGPVLVLLHGAGHHAGTWSTLAPRLIQHFTLVIPDLAGHGGSAPRTGLIETSAIVAGLEAVLATLLQGRRATLMGNSLGGWMAMVLAHRHPEWTERVVGVNGGALRGLDDVNLLPRSREEAKATMALLRDPSSPPVPANVLDDLARRDERSSIARFAATAATMEDWYLDEAQLRELHCPVALLWGSADHLLPLAYAERMAAVLPEVQLVPIDRCGHVPQQEAPDRLLEALAKVFPQLAP